MKTQAWTFLTAVTLLAGITVNAQSQDQSGRVKIADSRVMQTQGATPHVIGQPLENSGSAQIIPQESFSPNNYSGGQAMVTDGSEYYPSQNYYNSGYNQQSRLPAGVMTHPETDDPFQTQFGVDQRVGGLQGYEGSYTGIRMFAPFATSDGSLWFVEPRVNITDDGSPGANIGIGHRMYSPFHDAVNSLSGWWDYDDGHQFNYQQVGVSWSYLTRYWKLRANGYYVTSENNNTISSQNVGEFFYQSNFLLQNRSSQVETAYNGLDAEIGGPIPLFGIYGFNWAAGGYYLEGIGDEDAVGVKGRVEAQINEDWRVNVSISEDKIFGTNVQMGVQVNLADAMPARWFRQYDMYKYLALPEERNYRVNTHVATNISQDKLINPADGNPFCIAHIIPDAVGPAVPEGDGSIENPFNSLEAYRSAVLNPNPENCDIILVRGSDAAGTNLQHGITIFERQRLLGAGVSHEITGIINGITRTFDLPETGTGISPVLFNTFDPPGINTSVVTIDPSLTIAQDSLTEISGFQIDGTPGGAGIPLNIGINGVGALDGGINVNRNTILDTRIGVNFINSVDAQAIFDTNTITGAGNSSLFGINVTQTSGSSLDLLIENNTITGVNGEDANSDGVLDAGEDTGLPDGTLAANGALEDGIGINLIAFGAGTEINANDSGNATNPLGITNNTVTGNGTGMRVVSQLGASQNLDFLNNSFSSNVTPIGVDATGGGLLLQADAANSIISVNRFTNNTLDNNAGNGALLSVTNTAAIEFLDPDSDNEAFNGNSFDGNGSNGMFISANNGTILFDHLGSDFNPVTSNSFNNNTVNGLQANIFNGGDLTITDPVNNVTFNNNGDNGFLVDIDGAGSVFSAQFGDLIPGGVGNQFNGNGGTSLTGDGFNLTATNDPSITLSFFNNQFNNNTDDGLEINLTNMLATALDGVTSSDNQFLSNVNGNGMHFVANAADITDLTISDNTAGGPPGGTSSNGLSGLFFDLANLSTLENTLIDGNNFEANDQHGIHYQVNNSNIIANTTTGNIITGQVNGNGIFIDSITDPMVGIDTLEFAFNDNEIINNGGAGILGNINSGDITALLNDNTITGNTDEGIAFSLFNASNFFSNEFDDNTVSNNLSYGLRLSGVDTANITLDTAGTGGPNVFSGNGNAGVLLELADNATSDIFQISNTTISNTLNPATGNPLDLGDGLRIRLTDNAVITQAAFTSGVLTSNTGFGANILAQGNAILQNLDITDTSITLNRAGGMNFERTGNAIIGQNSLGGQVNLTDVTVDANIGNGISVSADGGLTNITDTSVNINAENLVVSNNTLDGINVLTGGNSSVNFGLLNSDILTNGADGIQVEVRQNAIFRGNNLVDEQVMWDGIRVNGNEDNGIRLSNVNFDPPNDNPNLGVLQGFGQLYVNMVGDARLTEIRNNEVDGVNILMDSASTSNISIRNPAFVAVPGRDHDVEITGNGDEGIEYDQSNGVVNVDVNNTLIQGLNQGAGTSGDGINISVTGGDILLASGMTLNNVTISQFDGNGITYVHNDTFGLGTIPEGPLYTLTLDNTRVGINDFDFNDGDGLNALINDDGSTIKINNSEIGYNRGTGVAIRTVAEDFLNGRREIVRPAFQQDSTNNGIGDTIFDNNGLLNTLAYYYTGPFGGSGDSFNDLYGFDDPPVGDIPDIDNSGTPDDLSTYIADVNANLNINNSSISFNNVNGLKLEVGTSTLLNASLQGNTFEGSSTDDDLFIRPWVSANPDQNSIDRGEGQNDEIVLDPVALLNLDFGNLIPNVGNNTDIRGFGTNLPNGLFTNSDAFKDANRSAVLRYDVIGAAANTFTGGVIFPEDGNPPEPGRENAVGSRVDIINP